MSNVETMRNPNDDNLTIRDHLDPDKHWIGETLPAPSLGETTFAGVLTAVGESPFPARADHSHDTRTRQTFVNSSVSKSVAPGPAVYIDSLATTAGWEDFLHAGSTQLLDFPLEGSYAINCRFTVTRSSGIFPATTAYQLIFAYSNGVSLHAVDLANLPENRGSFTKTVTEFIAYSSITATSNLQVSYTNYDTVAHNVTLRMVIIRQASSHGVDTE
jgi:hypothetical protein